MAFRCTLCDRSLGTSEYKYQLPLLSASQGDGEEPITVCASCNWYFDGTTNGLTPAMRDAFTAVVCGSFMELPKDRMLWYLASACEATATGGSLSGWFSQIRNALSGGGIDPV